MTRSLDILILSDGRPGHFNLSDGIAAALEKQTPATTRMLDVRRRQWPGHILAALSRTGLPAASLLRGVYRIRDQDVPPCDVIISAGAETLAANIWLARIRKVPNIFYGSLRLYDPNDFSLVMTSYARHSTRANQEMTIKPSRIDPDSLTPPKPLTTPNLTVGLLIGGNAGGVRFAPEDWSQLVRTITESLDQTAWSWKIANSRRTDPAVSVTVAGLHQRYPARIDFLDVNHAGPGTLASLIGTCDVLLCTADSSSMISECAWSRRPTLSLSPQQCIFTPDEFTYRDWLESQRCCRSVTIATLDLDTIRYTLGEIRPLTNNPQAGLAQLIRRHIPQLLGR